jgi:histone deacetylase HOS3
MLGMQQLSAVQVYLQEECLKHRFIRSRDTSTIVERPERLRALAVGLAGAIARLELASPSPSKSAENPDELAAALERMDLSTASSVLCTVKSTARVDLLNHAAVKFVHGDIDGDVYLEKLISLAKGSADKVASGESEIPEGLSQGDLYRTCRTLALHCSCN